MNLDYLKAIFIKLIETVFSTDGWLYKTVFAIVMFFAGIHVYVASVIVLVVIDVITGVWASVKKGEPFKSKILRQGLIEKLVLYVLLLVGAFFLGEVLQHIFGYKTYFIAGALAILINVYEISSIIENIIVINKELRFLNTFKDLLMRWQTKQIENIEKKLDIDENENKTKKEE